MISFWVENNTSARPTQVMTDSEYEGYDAVNETWFRVTVKNSRDKEKWLEMNNYLQRLLWEPNQNPHEQGKDEELENQLFEEMKKLEIR